MQTAPGRFIITYGLTSRRGDGTSQASDAQVAQAIHAYVVGDLLDAAVSRNELVLLGNIDAKVARMTQRG
jgi:hypothetical protein